MPSLFSGSDVIESLIRYKSGSSAGYWKINGFESQAAKSFNQISTVLNSSPSAIIGIDSSMNVIAFNKSAELMFGYKRKHMKSLEDIESIVPTKYLEKSFYINNINNNNEQ